MSYQSKFLTMAIIFLLLTSCTSNEVTSIPSSIPIGLDPTPSPTAHPTSTLMHTPAPTAPHQEPLDFDRVLLTYDQLMNGFDDRSPIDEAALTYPASATLPFHTFEGRLELHGEANSGSASLTEGELSQASEIAHLPEFDFEFVQNDGYLIPVQRGIIITRHPYWNYIIEPGRVWQEAGDQGYSRASFPFAMFVKGSNHTVNGTMTFLFRDDEISKVWYQVTQETIAGFDGEMWGLLEATYHPTPVKDAANIKAEFTQELANRFPSRPIEQLADDYPGVDVSAFGHGIPAEHMTWYGFVVNGINYVGGCHTPYGIYPYCEYMRAPSYSTAKSAFVSVALMRLAQKYDPNLPNLLIKDYVPEAANSDGDWSLVTFENVLDMATGNFMSTALLADEESYDTDPFWTEQYYDGLIDAAFRWPSSAPPGTTWVYHTSETFILTAALQNYLRIQEGPEADIYEFVVEEVYKPLKMGPGVYTVLRTRDNDWQGQPYGGLGQWWIPDDLAKLSTFLNMDGGTIDGVQVLDPDLLAAALQRNPEDRGVDRVPAGKYNNAFWAELYPTDFGYGCEFWVPVMEGYSGIVVALFPNGSTYYYASDNQRFTWTRAVRQSDRIEPHCP